MKSVIRASSLLVSRIYDFIRYKGRGKDEEKTIHNKLINGS